MKYKVDSFLKELLDHEVISNAVGEDIRRHFEKKKKIGNSSRLVSIFGVLGALLIGAGIMLIVAHNWDDLTRSLKSFLAFIPVLMGLAACGYALFKKPSSFTWAEGASVFLTFAIGSCIGLISQVYNIPGSVSGYLLTWSILCLPLIYIMESSITSMLYIVCIAFVGVLSEFPQAYYFWALLVGILPFYFILYRKDQNANALYFHHWLVPISIVMNVVKGSDEVVGWFVFPTLIVLFGGYYLLSQFKSLDKLSLLSNGYRIIGSAGTVILLLVMSFYDMWKEFAKSEVDLNSYLSSSLFIIIVLLVIASIYLLYTNRKTQQSWMSYTWVVFIPIFILGYYQPLIGTIGINLLLSIFSVLTIYKGISKNHLGIVNYGLLSISALIICRFFDIQIPFIARGLIFIAIGCAFFLVNYQLVQNRKIEQTKIES